MVKLKLLALALLAGINVVEPLPAAFLKMIEPLLALLVPSVKELPLVKVPLVKVGDATVPTVMLPAPVLMLMLLPWVRPASDVAGAVTNKDLTVGWRSG